MSCNCVYVFESSLVLLLYVDDTVIFGKDKLIINRVLKVLSNHFNLKLLGRIRKLLGVKFEQHGNCLKIRQTHYIEEVCEGSKGFTSLFAPTNK